MSPRIIIKKPGVLTTLQDLGRYGFQQFGMPVAGAMDKYALQVANLLVGNSRSEAGLEITMPGVQFKFEGSCRAAITGADLGAKLNGEPLQTWQSFNIKNEGKLEFTQLNSGSRAYLVVQGGYNVPPVMGSKSTYMKGKVGGFQGRKLEQGDILEINNNDKANSLPSFIVPEEFTRKYTAETVVRVVPGPQDDFFEEEEINKFFASNYTVTQQSDRMGYRLDGPALKHKKDYNIITEGLTLGSIQIVGDGRPIVMMAEHHSAGGYSKIAHVITIDMPYLGQLKQGDRVSFKKIVVEEAQQLLKNQEEQLQDLEKYIKSQNQRQNQNANKTSAAESVGEKAKRYKMIVNGQEYNATVEEIK